MKKGERIEAFVGGLALDGDAGLPACYRAYFACFNAGEYYEAHDVLEHLWLDETGPDRPFFQGLIQIAGAFVHLRKQHERPWHVKDGRRLRPAVRLFDLGVKNIAPFAPRHMALDVASLVARCEDLARGIEASGFTRNPWSPAALPQLSLDLEG